MSEVTIDEATLLRLQKLAAVGEVSVGISHETRNLLTAIVGFTQVAAQRAKSVDTALHYFALVEREALRCIDLLEPQLALARRAPDAIGNLVTIVDEVATATRHELGLRRIALELQLRTVPSIRMGRGELQQVLLNLVINALHATPIGGTITITAQALEGMVELAVADTGPGVPAEIRESIFDAFFTTKGDRGTGLGLALCRRLLEACGGTLDLDASYTTGARFVARLPVQR